MSDLVRLLDPVRLNCLGGFFCLGCLRGGPNFDFLFLSFNPKRLFPRVEGGGGEGGRGEGGSRGTKSRGRERKGAGREAAAVYHRCTSCEQMSVWVVFAPWHAVRRL